MNILLRLCLLLILLVSLMLELEFSVTNAVAKKKDIELKKGIVKLDVKSLTLKV